MIFRNYQRKGTHGFCQTFALIEFLKNNPEIYNQQFQEKNKKVSLPDFKEGDYKGNNLLIADFYKKLVKSKINRCKNPTRDDILTKSMWSAWEDYKKEKAGKNFNSCVKWLIKQCDIFIKGQKECESDITLS